VSRERSGVVAASNGCYDAGRAAALSGVPKSTVYYWARVGIVVPSVSPLQEKLWSYADLMALRLVAWLRHRKSATDNRGALPASPMPQVRAAIEHLENAGVPPWRPGGASLLAAPDGRVFIRLEGETCDAFGQKAVLPDEHLALTEEYGDGPNLVAPRRHLRIVPAKVAGEPHLEGTRLTTQSVAALIVDGYEPEVVAAMYEVPLYGVMESVDLERQLSAPTVVVAA